MTTLQSALEKIDASSVGERTEAFAVLTRSLWAAAKEEMRPTAEVEAACRMMLERLKSQSCSNCGRLAVLLGLVCEADEDAPRGDIRKLLLDQLDALLDLAGEAAKHDDRELFYAVAYLVAQFEERGPYIVERLKPVLGGDAKEPSPDSNQGVLDFISRAVLRPEGVQPKVKLDPLDSERIAEKAPDPKLVAWLWKNDRSRAIAYLGARADNATARIQ
jgi:hypothetical protein